MTPKKLDPNVKAARELYAAAEAYLHHVAKKPEGKYAVRALEKLRAAAKNMPQV